MSASPLDSLRSEWSTLYSQTLPKLARSKDAAQPKWPVTLDHCFARIILDNTIGRGVLQWDNVIKKPAVKHMTEQQFKAAIELGEKIKNGDADLVELDKKSLQARGKGEKKYKNTKKRGLDESDAGEESRISPKKAKSHEKIQSTLGFAKDAANTRVAHKSSSTPYPSDKTDNLDVKGSHTSTPDPNTIEFLTKIQNHQGLTPYRKRLYSTLLSVPSGSYTTYQAMATFLNSSARAIGNGMRNNPFAPDVPCHRVLASDGSIGGFYGSWGEEGEHAGKKRELLKSEGVYFDSRGKVKGPVFRQFEDLQEANID